jgi:hypothetical protein
MPLPDAFACVRADLRNARRALEAQLALAMEDEPAARARRVGIIQMYLERIPVMFEHSRHGERSSCILVG